MKKRPLLAAFLLTQMICGGFAQQTKPTPASSPPPLQPTATPKNADDVVKITTNLVQVDAVVTGKNGEIVADLKPEEIELYEDGKRQQVTNFSWNARPAKIVEKKTEAVNKNEANGTIIPVPLPALA